MTAHPEDDAARLRFFARLADGELFVLLQDEAAGETVAPRVFALQDGPVVLAFDSEERLAEFAGGIAPYAALPGRVIAAQLLGQGIGLGVNLGAPPSATLLPPEALDWLARVLAEAPQQVKARPQRFVAPRGLPEALLVALDRTLARAGGLAGAALLAGVVYEDGRAGHMLAFLDAAPGAEAALARAASEALVFSGVEAGEMDVAFLSAADPSSVAMARVALRFDLPPPEARSSPSPQAPGTDPDRPPRLR
jgi:hypothetical protein